MKWLVIILIILWWPLHVDASAKDEDRCAQGVHAAFEAYTDIVINPQHVALQLLADDLDLRIARQPFPVDRDDAIDALAHIINTLRSRGLTLYRESDVIGAASDYIYNVCQPKFQ